MSSLANLAPIPTRNKGPIKKESTGSDDEFDALLDDMLESPTKGNARSNKQKNQTASRNAPIKYDEYESFDSTEDLPTSLSPNKKSSATSGISDYSKKSGNNVMDDSNDLSSESEDGLLMNVTANTDDLEDSILGGLLKSKTRSKKIKNVNEVASSSSKPSNSESRNNKNTDSKPQITKSASFTNDKEKNKSSNNDWEDSDNSSDFDLKTEKNKRNINSTYSASTSPNKIQAEKEVKY